MDDLDMNGVDESHGHGVFFMDSRSTIIMAWEGTYISSGTRRAGRGAFRRHLRSPTSRLITKLPASWPAWGRALTGSPQAESIALAVSAVRESRE